MPNYSLHLISMPRGDACQGRAASFKISHIRLAAIQPGRRVRREERRPHELWGNFSRNVEDFGVQQSRVCPTCCIPGSTWMLVLAGDIPRFMGSRKGFMAGEAQCGAGTDRYRAQSVFPAISHELFDQGKLIRLFNENSIFFFCTACLWEQGVRWFWLPDHSTGGIPVSFLPQNGLNQARE